MVRFLITFFVCLSALVCFGAELSLEDCVDKAVANYPLIKKYELINVSRNIDLSDINKAWLPRIGAYGQVTGQNVVPSFPSALSGVIEQMGQEMKGLGKVQYKVGVDISQAIWDGGVSKARREVARAQSDVETSAVEVELYDLRQRVENVYFAILLTEEQIKNGEASYNLLSANLEKLKSMERNGTAMQADVDMVEAQLLELNQTLTQAHNALESYKSVIELYIGEEVGDATFVCPSISNFAPTIESNRPELTLFEKQMAKAEAAQRLSDTSTMPSVGLFAQSYYGYPGLNYFNSMINREWSFNIIAGMKISWNIDSFYTKKNTARKTASSLATIEVEKDVFLFNNNLQATSITKNIEGLRKVIEDDSKIVELRKRVRKAAESQLENGIIDTTALLSKITDENIASLNSSYHRIKLAQEIYNLKYTLNQ